MQSQKFLAWSVTVWLLLLAAPLSAPAQARSSVRAVAASDDNSFALASDGTVWEWGGAYLQTPTNVPAKVS